MGEAKRLTYGMVDGVLKGLWEYLIRGQRFTETEWHVLEDGRMVGYGKIMKERPRRRRDTLGIL